MNHHTRACKCRACRARDSRDFEDLIVAAFTLDELYALAKLSAQAFGTSQITPSGRV